MHPDQDEHFHVIDTILRMTTLEPPRVVELPASRGSPETLAPERFETQDVLWFSPRPPPIELSDIPDILDSQDRNASERDADEDRPSVIPVAAPALPPPRRRASPLNPALTFGVIGALVAAAYFAQPHAHGCPIAQLVLAFPDRVVIDMTEPPPLLHAEDLPVFRSPAPSEPPRPQPRPSERPAPAPADTPAPPLPEVAPPDDSDTKAPPFEVGNALAALHASAGSASHCVASSGPATARVHVTFAPSGRVTVATIGGDPLAGTKAGGCVARTLRSARMDPFDGPPVTVRRTLRLRP